MAGHSKWANIQHRKGRQDEKRGRIWTRIIREIMVAARQGGGDLSANPRLRLALDKALGANMSRDIIDRAVARGAGAADTDEPLQDPARLKFPGKLGLRRTDIIPLIAVTRNPA